MRPLSLYIPPGTHMHLGCPVHPEGHVLRGSSVTLGAQLHGLPGWNGSTT